MQNAKTTELSQAHIELLKRLWHGGVVPTAKDLATARQLGLACDDWLPELLNDAARAEYKKACDASWAECYEVDRSAQAKYQLACKMAEIKCAEACKMAKIKRAEACQAADAKCVEACDAAFCRLWKEDYDGCYHG